MEEISSNNHAKGSDVLHRVNQLRNILHTKKKKEIKKATWIVHILRRNCLVKHIMEGKIEGELEVTVRRGRKRKQLLDDLTKKTGN